jgi:hypothetical protein
MTNNTSVTATTVQWWSPSLNIEVHDQRVDIAYHASYTFINKEHIRLLYGRVSSFNKASIFRTLLLILANRDDYNRNKK